MLFTASSLIVTHIPVRMTTPQRGAEHVDALVQDLRICSMTALLHEFIGEDLRFLYLAISDVVSTYI